MDLRGSTALVTGGSGDLGSAICRSLAAAGCTVTITYAENRTGADNVASLVTAAGSRVAVLRLDQADPASVEAAVAATVEQFGRLDILVNNAAWNIGIPFPDLDALTPEIWDRIFATNARGPFLLARAAARPMRDQHRGRIVNIASIGGLMPAASSIAYACAKAALIHLTRCLAVALGPDVLVNCVAPGLIEGTRIAQRLPPEISQMARSRAVLGHAASTDDIADQVVAFCRTDSATGQTLVVDGGVHFH